MEVKKCNRCGCFFVSNTDICSNCMPKDNLELNNLKNYLNENGNFSSIEELSINTGISSKNLARYLTYSDFAQYTPIAPETNIQ